MKYLNAKGAAMPALGFGTFRLDGQQCVDMVCYALEVGYRHVDTASMYGNEAEVGTGLTASGVAREEIFLTTKIWSDQLAYADCKRSAAASLERLKTDYVDLLLIHWPSEAIALADTLRALAELRTEGKTRHIGVSNFPVALLREAVEKHGADLLCNQVEYHPYLSQRPVLDYLHEHAMALTAYCPLARGETTNDPTLTRIGQRHGKTASQVALRWFIEQDNVAAIPKAGSREHCLANFQIFDFSLDAEDLASINALSGNRRLINPSWSPRWDPA